MSSVATLQLQIDGPYRDLWLYKKRIYLWERTGRLLHLHVDDALKYLLKEHGRAVANLAQTLIFRNDWKVGEQLQGMLKIPEIHAGFFRPFSDRTKIEIKLPIGLFSNNDSEAYAGPVLDSSIYANRVYLATPDGVLETYINPKYPDRTYSLDRQADFRASKLSVRSAAINASAEDEGLFFARIALNDSDDPYPAFQPADWRRIANFSLSAGHASRNLLNYTGAATPSLLKARTEKAAPHENARYEEQQVVGYDDPIDISDIALSALGEKTTIGASSNEPRIEIIGNSEYHLLASWKDSLRVLDLRAFEGPDLEARVNRHYRRHDLSYLEPETMLETYPINKGFVAELRDSLHLITQSGTFLLKSGASARVRTFISSLRHKEVAATIDEDAAVLVGFYIFDDALF